MQGWPILTPYSGGTFSQSACFTAHTRYPQLVYQGLTQIFSSVSYFVSLRAQMPKM